MSHSMGTDLITQIFTIPIYISLNFSVFQILSEFDGVDIRIKSMVPEVNKIKCLFKVKDK